MQRSRIFALTATLLLIPLGADAADWTVPGDFATLQDAIDAASVVDGDTIRIGPGRFDGALLDKSLFIKGKGRAIIDDGPVHSSGLIQGLRLLAGSGGSTISHLTFEVDFPVINAASVDDVTVTQCRFENVVQGVSNWGGVGWEISHNRFRDLRTRCGGGIAILVGDFLGGEDVTDSVVSHNRVKGTLHVDANDCGGYNGTGIVIFADFRFGRTGTGTVAFNRVVKNHISMVSDNPGLVDIVAFELTDTRDDTSAIPYPVIHDNAIGFNDFRGTTLQVDFTPDGVEDHNVLSRNFGDNRGKGLHPSAFGPGGN